MLKKFDKRALCIAAVLASLTAGCATNAIRIDRAETMVAAGRTAGSATETLMQRTREANRYILIDIVSMDANCHLPSPVIMSGEPPKGSLFCREGGLNNQLYPLDWKMQRISARDLKATLAIIATLSGYLDLVDAVVTREPLDISGELSAAETDLRTIVGAASAISGESVGLPDLTKEQRGAIDGALALLSELLDESNRVDDLRAIETIENRILFANSVTALRDANTSWSNKLETQLSQRQTLLEDRLDRMTKASEAQRRPVVESLMNAIEEREKLAQLRSALQTVVDKLQISHNAYLALLDDANSELTKAERKKLAKLNHDRVMGALKSLTAIVAAF